MKKPLKREEKLGGLLVLGGLFVGIGIGLAVEKTGAGSLIGLGVGFLAAFVFAVLQKK